MGDNRQAGFTLIELSIVLVIIGLIVGGVVVGQDLIQASYVRAQLTQIEKYNTAVNTFYGKYQGLPGDLLASLANEYGFSSRDGSQCGHGDGNGIIEGAPNADTVCYTGIQQGEPFMFWSDLINSGLIANGGGLQGWYANGGIGAPAATITGNPSISFYLPAAAIGQSNFVYVYNADGMNYYGISEVSQIDSGGTLFSTVGMTVRQAYKIDSKVDDGSPQTGNVLARYLDYATMANAWIWAGAVDTAATPGTPSTCYDNNNSSTNAVQNYSTQVNGGAGLNCALSFKMQGGD